MKTIYKHLILSGLLIFSCNSLIAQLTLTLQPDAAAGKDAHVNSNFANDNYGTNRGLYSAAWTWSSSDGTIRSFFEFDLTPISPGSTVISAYLSLYNDPGNNIVVTNGEHSNLTSSNESYISRVTGPWDENTLTWSNQPMYTTTDEITLAQSLSVNQDYTNLDVTNMVQYMVDNPSSNYGFVLRLINEIKYAALIFGSSDNTDPTNRPMLVVEYYDVNGLEELNGQTKTLVKVTDLLGRDTEIVDNTPLIYIYSDGSIERIYHLSE